MKFRLGQKCKPARARGIERWKGGRRRGVREGDPFRSIKANKWRRWWGCWWRPVMGMGIEGNGEEWEEERKGKRCHERNDRALWVYAIKNVNICRRLVIGCKYGGGRVRCRGQMGRGGSHSSFVSLFIGMRGARRIETHAPPRERAPGSSLSSFLLSSRLEICPRIVLEMFQSRIA